MKTVTAATYEWQDKAFLFLLKYILGSFFIFCLLFILLKFPERSAEGIRKGIDICLDSLVPGLYPFMIISNAFVLSSLSEIKIPFADKLCRFLFSLPGSTAIVIIFSFIGGLPVGASMSCGLYERGVISQQQCRRLISFCVNPGPAFVISVIGVDLLGFKGAGVIIYVSLVLSSLIIGIASRFFTGENEGDIRNEHSVISCRKETVAEKAVIKSSRAILTICSWVVAFSCIGELISGTGLPESMSTFLLCILEMTKGSFVAAEKFPVPVIAAVIGFSGFCGHLQLMGYIRSVGMEYKYFLAARIINSGLSAVICNFLLKLFPVASETFCVGVRPSAGERSGSVFLSVLMILMAVLFVMGDDYRVVRKKFDFFQKN